LVEGRDPIALSIKLGTVMRFGRGTPYAKWTHAALVLEVESQDPNTIKIVEATRATGVHWTYLHKYAGYDTKILHTHVTPDDWVEVRRFLQLVLDTRERYDPVTYLGLTLYALTGTNLCIQEAGTATCSGLVCEALTRAGYIWTRPPYACTPADIAADLDPEGFQEHALHAPRVLGRWPAPAFRDAAVRARDQVACRASERSERSSWPA
jgi:hypothetical protein